MTNVLRIVGLGGSICRILRGFEAPGGPDSNGLVGPAGPPKQTKHSGIGGPRLGAGGPRLGAWGGWLAGWLKFGEVPSARSTSDGSADSYDFINSILIIIIIIITIIMTVSIIRRPIAGRAW